jgi:cell division protein FtsI/penicillin-binding protein 2
MNPVNIQRRLRVILLATQLLFVLLVGRLFQIQWAQSDRFDAGSAQQRIAVVEKVKRGAIYDRNYHELALTKSVYSVGVYPGYYRDLIERANRRPEDVERRKTALGEILAENTGLPLTRVMSLLNSAKGFEWIQRRVEFSVILRIEEAMRAHKLGWFPRSAAQYEVEEKRFYPRGSLAAHTIGFTNIDGIGQEGIERSYERRLQSRVVSTATVRDGKGRAIDPFIVGARLPESSESVVTTIDERIQYVLQKELAAQVASFQAKSGVGIVMNPQTGEILGIANVPDYDLNHYNDPNIPPVVRKNRATWWPYEPGSVFKVVTLGALLDAGRIRLDEVIYCENGSYKPHPKIKSIKDAHPYGELTFAQVIQKSSNIGTLKAAQRLTQREYAEYVRKFGLLSTTGVDIPFERRGDLYQVTHPEVYYAMYFAPWGQGVSVTPLQMLNALNVIANKGLLMKPYLVKRILDGEGNVIADRVPTIVRQVIREEAAKMAAEVLVGAVEKGTGSAAKIPGVRVAGKTGTSQKAAEDRRGYLHGQYMSSFVGFFPADNPRYSILILVDEPHGLHYGGQVAAPVFQRVAMEILSYEKMQPLMLSRIPQMPEGFAFRKGNPEVAPLYLPATTGNATREVSLQTEGTTP